MPFVLLWLDRRPTGELWFQSYGTDARCWLTRPRGTVMAGNSIVLASATVVAFGAGWGWPGLYHHAVIQNNPTSAAAATGVVLTGLAAGGAVGPLAFGLIANQLSFKVAWGAAAGAALLSAMILPLTSSHVVLASAPMSHH